MADEIRYSIPIDQLDKFVQQIYQEGKSLMLPDNIRREVDLRYQQWLHKDDDDDEENSEFSNMLKAHEEAMAEIEERQHRSHTRTIMVLDLDETEQATLRDDMSCSFVRQDPNSSYNLSDEDISDDAERREIFRRLQTVSKVYYSQEDYMNAIAIIRDAIDYSLRHDYPWMSYPEALRRYRAGKIRYTYAPIPVMMIDYRSQVTDPKMLAGIANGSIKLIDQDEPVAKKKKKKSKGITMDYMVIQPKEHARYVEMHNAGYNTPISTILKSCSTIYSRYVMPPNLSYQMNKTQQAETFDWLQPNAGEAYYKMIHGESTNKISEIVSALQAANGRGVMNRVIGTSMQEFVDAWKPKQERTFKTISSSLEEHDQAVQIERNLMDLMRASNPQL